MSHSEPSVLIVGAGASGLTLACDLRRRGVSCRIVEKLTDPFPGSRGKGLQPRTLEVFDDLGVVGAITRAGGPFPLFRGRSGDKVLWDRDLAAVMGLARLEPGTSAPYSMWMCPQYATEAVLRDRLSDLGGEIERGTELTSFVASEDGVVASLASARGVEETRVAYLVGADGGKSFVRTHLGVAFRGKTGTYRSIIADVDIEGIERGFWHIWMGSERSDDRVTLCALPGTNLFQFSAPVAEENDGEVTLASIKALFDERSGGFPLRWRRISWSTRYRLNARLAERFQVGRVLLAGDAAHVHSPFGGQGINTSIQDAYNLGWKLEAALRGVPKVLETYEAERMAVAADVLGLSSGLQRENYEGLAAAGVVEGNRDIYQLRISYRGSTLSREYRQAPGRVQAGDRAPDARCALGSGMPLRIFDLLRGPHWTVLSFGQGGFAVARSLADRYPNVRAFHVSTTPEVETGASVLDASEEVHRAYDVASGSAVTFAIRPDGYLGFATDTDALARVTSYLAEFEGQP